MFGMLDYRAHKLLWLIFLPMRLLSWVVFLVGVAVAVFVAQQAGFSFMVKIIIACIAFVVIDIITFGILATLFWLIRRAFFWTVDIIPADGRTKEEAHAVVLDGRRTILSLKLVRDIGSWTWEDTEEFIRLPNWRARWFFDMKTRAKKRIAILQRYYEETGRQPEELTPKEAKELTGYLDYSSLEHTLMAPWFFNSVLAFLLIVGGLIALNPQS